MEASKEVHEALITGIDEGVSRNSALAAAAVVLPEPVAYVDATSQTCRMAGSWMAAGDWDALFTEQQVRAMLANQKGKP